MSKRGGRRIGVIPRLFQGLREMLNRLIRHPQSALATVVLIAGVWMVGSYVQRADAFRVTQVIVPSESSLKVPSRVIGTNLWELDVDAVARELKQEQPWWKDIRVIRTPPNAIRIEPIPRLPIAQVQIDRWHAVDENAFILPSASGQSTEGLVRLIGISRGGGVLKVGKDNPDPRLHLALRILAAIRRTHAGIGKRLEGISVADPRQIHLLLQDGTEVRCGDEAELDAQLKRLQAVLRTIEKHPVAARYIDMRFQQPVVGSR